MIDYKSAGVDVTRGYKLVDLIKKGAAATYDENVPSGLGSFGGFYNIPKGYNNPVLVAGTDGVGTKLRYAIVMDKHDTIGTDCVAMCVNDVVCQGAKPLFFLDYVACGKLDPEKMAGVVNGVAKACKEVGCALIGGETAEMPGMYPEDEYDLAGFTVGIVDRDKIVNGSTIKAGDVLVGLASSGVHSNGFSLVRKLLGEDRKELEKYDASLGMTVGEAVLTPTRLYVNSALALTEKFKIEGIAHITGGGFIENIPRIIPKGLGVEVDLNSFPRLPIFNLLAEKSGLPDEKLYNTFNMGIGLVLAVRPEIAEAVKAEAIALGEKAYIIGKVTDNDGVKLLRR
ncbi:MAG: phosphoribosylformylglycinamidine cyclo-ligase [Clostridia bacterium]|nr:phosphoribosylformylglycinamidine cyclo-ligase [Clostridia bacterium]